MKWTLDTLQDLQDESDSDGASLPQPKEICRASLAEDGFDTQQFLTDHAAFRSLNELQESVKQWETRLHDELLELVNQDFEEFVSSVESVRRGEPSLEGIHNDIKKFDTKSKLHEDSLSRLADALDRELQEHKRLAATESDSQKLLYMFDILADLETLLPEASANDATSILILSKLYVAMALVASELSYVRAVSSLRLPMQAMFTELLAKLSASVAQEQDKKSRLQLLEAREHVLDAGSSLEEL